MENGTIELGENTYEFTVFFDKIANFLLAFLVIILLIGIIYIAILEWKTVIKIIKKQEKFSLQSSLAKKLRYLASGFFLTLVSCLLAKLFINNIHSQIAITDTDYSYQDYSGEISYYSLLINVVFHYLFLGLSGVGVILTLSASGKWMVNLAKFSATLIFFLPLLYVLINQLRFLLDLL
jgi:uncharacterized membrane protein YidH (DUF202 family)